MKLPVSLVLAIAALASCGARPALTFRRDAAAGEAGTGERAPLPADAGPAPADAPRPDAAPISTADPPRDASAPDAARDGSTPDADAGLRADAAADGVGLDVVRLPPRTLSLVLAGGPWNTMQRTAGMAVDEQDRVFLEDKTNVYMIAGSTAAVYLTLADVMAGAGVIGPSEIEDLDRGPDGLLYILIWGDTFLPSSAMVVRSGAPHVADPWLAAPNLRNAKRLSVETAERVALVSDEGLTIRSPASSQGIYTSAQIRHQFQCAWEHLVVAPSGVFLQLPGCNDGILMRGKVDGSGVDVLYDGNTFKSPTSSYTPNFVCSARDPAGGFYFILGRILDGAGSHLYHVSEDASGANGLELVDTVPSLLDASKTQNDTFAFDFCSLAVAPDGTVFYQTWSQLWKISP